MSVYIYEEKLKNIKNPDIKTKAETIIRAIKTINSASFLSRTATER